MDHRLVFAPARLAARAFGASTATTILTALMALGDASAQAPPAPPAPKAQPAPKAAPKAAPAPKPAEAPPQAQQAQPQQGQAQGGEQPQLIFSPWTKFCLKGQEANAKQVCFTGKDGRVESGMPVVAAVLIEPENEPKKVLRVTLPLGMSLAPGTRVIVDNGQPMTGPYVICFNNGCMADYEASGELIGKLKKGQGLVIQGINGAGQPISLVVPLGDFAKAYDGPPTDPKEFEAQQQKLQAELQRRAEEARKKLEGQQQAAPTR
jgi:invasion protein IalB